MKIKRIAAGKTQVVLWRETGIHQWRLSLIERGLKPRNEEALKIARALNTKPEVLFTGIQKEIIKKV